MNKTCLILISLLIYALAAAANEEHQAGTDRPSASDLMQQVESKYKSMKSYTSSGEVVIDLPVGDGKRRQQQRLAFLIRMTRAGRFLIQWDQTLPDGRTNRSAMWGDINNEKVMVTPLDGGKPVEVDRYVSFAMMGATSVGVAQTIPPIFFDLPGQPPMSSWLIEPTYEKEETIEGDDCYVVSGWYGPLKRVYWVSKKTLLIRQQRQVFGDGTQPPEMTDEWINGLLEASGPPAISVSIAEYREAFNAIREDKSGQKGTITETHSNIQVDIEINDDQLEPEPKE